jgi:hypothetical protein
MRKIENMQAHKTPQPANNAITIPGFSMMVNSEKVTERR